MIHRIESTNINEPLTDTHASAFDIPAHDHFVPSQNDVNNNEMPIRSINPIKVTDLDGINKSHARQSIDFDSRNAINHVIVNDNQRNASTLSSDRSGIVPQLDNGSISTKTGTAKVFNKNDLRKRKIKSTSIDQLTDWKCPNISENSRYLECACDMPYTLRCSTENIHGLQQIAEGLRAAEYPVSLLDCTLKNVTVISDARIFENVSLHGLVISSGEIKRVHRLAFLGFKTALQTLGLPNNALQSVPSQSLAPLTSLDRLDLSNNRIKYLGGSDFLVCFKFFFLSSYFTFRAD